MPDPNRTGSIVLCVLLSVERRPLWLVYPESRVIAAGFSGNRFLCQVVYHDEESASGGHVREEEFHEFVLGRSTALLRTAYLLTHDWGQAEDLLQTALAKTWFARARITAGPEVYARATMVNTYASWWRRRWRGEVPTAQLPDRGGSDPMVAVDDRLALWRALGRLPRRQRAVLVLRYYEGLSEAEIAGVLGCAAGTVKSQAAKALAALRSDPDAVSTVPIEKGCV